MKRLNLFKILIGKLFQPNPKHRQSGMDSQSLGSMDGGVRGIPAIWIPAIHAGMTDSCNIFPARLKTVGFVALCAFASVALSEPLTIKLPAETAKLRPSDTPGYALALQKCAICHSTDYIEYQPPGMSEAQWTAEVGKMQHAYGAPITDDEVKLIGAYLAASYSGKPVQVTSGFQSNTPPLATITPIIADVRVLLDHNACLSCHAIDKKLVGPSYRDIAARYKDDPKAMDKLAEFIAKGGSGRWGDIPMPPFPALKPEELKSLAGFVVGQK
ncbi:MAG: c-type cytochrome [Candidatus Methylumidiphilus sp.]